MLLLTGASSRLGVIALQQAKQAGVSVRCWVADPRSLGAYRLDVEVVLDDLDDSRSYARALKGIHAIIDLDPLIASSDLDRFSQQPIRVWRLLRAARQSDVKQIVVVAPITLPGAKPQQSLELIRRVTADSEVPTTLISCSHVLTQEGQLVVHPGAAGLATKIRLGSKRTYCDPILADDVVTKVFAVLRAADQRNQQLPLKGPNRLTTRELVDSLAPTQSWQSRAIRIPNWLSQQRPFRSAVKKRLGGDPELLTISSTTADYHSAEQDREVVLDN